MQIIFGKESAEKLREKYTVLELETIQVKEDGTAIDVFCLIPGEKIAITDMPLLEDHIKLHNSFLDGIKRKDKDFCIECINSLRGKFGGEVDSYYDIQEERLRNTA